MSWLEQRLRIRQSTISSTQELSKKYKKDIECTGHSKTFEPVKFDFIMLLISGIILTWIIINAFITGKYSDGIMNAIIFTIVAFGMGAIAVNFDPTRNLKIILSKKGISINELHYQWREIYKTYIVTRRANNVSHFFLILALDSGVTHRFEITGLSGFIAPGIKLSAYVEHYRSIA